MLEDSHRILASSSFVWLEVMPKAVYHQHAYEVDYYNRVFRQVQRWADEYRVLIQHAICFAEKYGLGGMDALHVASAIQSNCDVLVTTEQPGKPMYRVKGFCVVYLLDL